MPSLALPEVLCSKRLTSRILRDPTYRDNLEKFKISLKVNV